MAYEKLKDLTANIKHIMVLSLSNQILKEN